MTHIALNAHLLAPGNGYRRAGIHQYISNILTHLPDVDDGLTYTVLANHALDQLSPQMHQQISTLQTRRPWKRIVWEQTVQPFMVRRLKPDLYHGMAFVAPRGLRCPSVVTVYDLSFVRYPEVLSRLRREYLQRFTRASCQRAARIIAISESTAQDMVRLWRIPRDKIDVTLLGVSSQFQPLPEDEVEAFRSREELPQRFLLFVGTLEPRKNLPLLLRAYARLPADCRQEVHLVIGGGRGWMYDEIFATIAQHNLVDTVHTPGYIPAEDLALWYNAAEALVYPTLYEGFGFPIIEAMACGKPVLASNSSSLPEAAGDVGILLPPDDEAAWMTAMLNLISDEQARAAISPSAIVWAREFTWERTARQTINSYQQAMV